MIPAASEPARHIALRAAGDGFTVALEPALPGDPAPSIFRTYREARGWAGGLRLVHRVSIVDEATG